MQKPELTHLASLAKKMLNQEKAIEQAENALKIAKYEYRQTQTKEIPLAMQNIGMMDFTLDNGFSISIRNLLCPNIREADRQSAFCKLRDLGEDAIIKTLVTLDFKKSQNDYAVQLARELRSKGLSVEVKESIHANTLKSWVKEMYENGRSSEIPPEIAVEVVQEAKIEKIK